MLLIDAFVGDREVAFYHAKYDAAALRKLCAAAGMPVPNWTLFDVERLAQMHSELRLQQSTLQGWVLALALLPPDEIERRRKLSRNPPPTLKPNKWLLHDAVHDAEAAALLALHFRDGMHLPTRRALTSGLATTHA